jgi:hypothetical protein
MKTMMLVALALFASTVPQPAKADDDGFLKASELLDRCKAHDRYDNNDPISPQERVYVGYCLGYVRGWTEATSTGAATDPNGHHLYFQPTVTISQVIHVFQKYLADHPQEENVRAHWILFRACEAAKILTP